MSDMMGGLEGDGWKGGEEGKERKEGRGRRRGTREDKVLVRDRAVASAHAQENSSNLPSA